MKLKERKTAGTVKIDVNVLKEARVICAEKSFNIQDYITECVRKENKKIKPDARS